MNPILHLTSPIRILAISGSLRAQSNNTKVLQAAALLAPQCGDIEVSLFESLAEIPPFNPDLLSSTQVSQWFDAVNRADGLLISCPEYARGVPGVLKNALDWLVGDLHFAGKPVGIVNASPRAHHAIDSLKLILETMAAIVVDDAMVTIPLLGTVLSTTEISKRNEFATPLCQALDALALYSPVVSNPREALGKPK